MALGGIAEGAINETFSPPSFLEILTINRTTKNSPSLGKISNIVGKMACSISLYCCEPYIVLLCLYICVLCVSVWICVYRFHIHNSLILFKSMSFGPLYTTCIFKSD